MTRAYRLLRPYRKPVQGHINDKEGKCVMCEARKKGLSCETISAAFDHHPSPATVRRHTIDIETPARTQRREAFELLKAGVSYRKIRDRLGTACSTLARWNAFYLLPKRKPGPKPGFRKEAA